MEKYKMVFGEITYEAITVGIAIIAALFSYFMFFYEGKHKKRIEFDIDLHNLGLKNSYRIIEIGVLAENKGYVGHSFDNIRIRVRGIAENDELNILANHNPRLEFPRNLIIVHPDSEIRVCKKYDGKNCPDELEKAKGDDERKCKDKDTMICPGDPNRIDLVPKRYRPFFVRPGVKQRFPIVVKIPKNWTHVLAKVTFKYNGTKKIHVTERAFQIKDET